MAPFPAKGRDIGWIWHDTSFSQIQTICQHQCDMKWHLNYFFSPKSASTRLSPLGTRSNISEQSLLGEAAMDKSTGRNKNPLPLEYRNINLQRKNTRKKREVPSRELTYPTLGSSENHLQNAILGGYVRSLEEKSLWLLQTWRLFFINTQEAKIESLCIPKTPGNKRNNIYIPILLWVTNVGQDVGTTQSPLDILWFFHHPWKQNWWSWRSTSQVENPVGGKPRVIPWGFVSQLFRLLRDFFPNFFPRFFKPPQKTLSSCQEARAWLVELGRFFRRSSGLFNIRIWASPKNIWGKS